MQTIKFRLKVSNKTYIKFFLHNIIYLSILNINIIILIYIKKKICQYINKKYFAIHIVKKGKYIDFKGLSPKYTINNKNFFG